MNCTIEKQTIQVCFCMVGIQGFEPWTPWSQTRCATRLRYTPKNNLVENSGIEPDVPKRRIYNPLHHR